MVVHDCMQLLLNCHKTSQAPGAFTVECPRGPMCVNKLHPRSAQQSFHKTGVRHFGFSNKVY